jgi:type II secretory pathway pseudopilin PulG
MLYCKYMVRRWGGKSGLTAQRRQTGDTLVEVLLSIAIVGLAVAGAYSLASRSLRTGVLAAERTQTNKVAETQIEALKFRQKISSADVWHNNFVGINNFCLDDTSTSQIDTSGTLNTAWKPIFNTGDPEKLVSKTDAPDGAGYDPACVDSSGKYFTNITTESNPSLGAGVTYLVTVRWLSISTGAISQSMLYYRLPDQQYTPPSDSPPIACTPKANDVVLLLDASSSMQIAFTFEGSTKTRWDVLKLVTGDFVNGVDISPASNHIGVITFDDNTIVESPITGNLGQIQAAITNMQDRANTLLAPGLQATEAQFVSNARPGAQKKLIIVTDGLYKDVPRDVVIQAAALLKSQGVIIDTVGINLDSQEAVDNLAAIANGISVNVDSGDDLQAILNSIKSQITCVTT